MNQKPSEHCYGETQHESERANQYCLFFNHADDVAARCAHSFKNSYLARALRNRSVHGKHHDERAHDSCQAYQHFQKNSEERDSTFNAREHVARELDLVARKSTRLNSSHANISYAVFCLKK